MVSLKEIGKICGLSESTVSKALKGAPGIRKETIARVREIARIKGYQPNAMVEYIQSGKSHCIGIAFNRFQCEYTAAIMESIYQVLYEASYDCFLIPWDKLVRDGADLFAKFIHRRVDGLLLFPMEKQIGKKEREALEKFHNPIVFVDCELDTAKADAVVSDNAGPYSAMIGELIRSGCRRIGFAGFSQVVNGLERKNAFLSAMKRYEMPVRKEWCIELSDCWNEAYGRIRELLSGKERPDALVCFNDYAASDALNAAFDLGIRVPEKLAIVGFGNLPLSLRARPRLSSVEQSPELLGRTATVRLIDRIEGRKTENCEKIIIPTKFIKRESIK